MQPRYDPTYNNNNNEVFLGYAGDIDVWTEWNDDYRDKKERWVIVVGPKDRKLIPKTGHNFDIYPIDGNVLSQRYLDEDGRDIHVELHEMCQVYELCVKHGYITVLEQADGI
jgi:hypothetical protein